MSERYLITGGTGFLGQALVRRLVREGHAVRVLDNDSRGSRTRLADLIDDIEIVAGDVRDGAAVRRAADGIDTVCHLAYVNGTENFYNKPDVVLDVAVRGMLSVIDAADVTGGRLLLMSSSEVYHNADELPTPEDVPLVVPDVHNPRYSYSGGKIISELLALHCATTRYEHVVLIRPHNVYGPDMGYEHVIPQFVQRMHYQMRRGNQDFDFAIQGMGDETRAFIYIDDFIEATRLVMEQGANRGIYHIGSTDELPIRALAHEVADAMGINVRVVPGLLQPGSPNRRCPNTTKLGALGFRCATPLHDGLSKTCAWYQQDLDHRAARKEVA